MLRFSLLASGSDGNALVVEADNTRILVDCGLKSAKEVERRLLERGISPNDLSAIVITHEHGDHIGSAGTMARRHQLPIYGSFGTLSNWADASKVERLCPFENHERFVIGGIEIQAFPVPHDARDPTQFVFSDGARRLGLLTDSGHITAHIVQQLSGCDALILEANHDPDLLKQSSYPPHLIRRIESHYGHLSNQQAADLLTQIAGPQLQHLVAAHLSEENNRPEWVQQIFAAVLGCSEQEIAIAQQETGLDWREIH